MSAGKVLEAPCVICNSRHDLIVDLGCMRGIIPREEGAIGIAEGTTKDIALISRVNKPVSFIVTDFRRDEQGDLYAVLSRRAAQVKCMENYLSRLAPGDIIPARSDLSFATLAQARFTQSMSVAILSLNLSRLSRIR